MKEKILLKFYSLASLSQFIKVIKPPTYLTNTIELTVLTALTSFELAVAQENFEAQVINGHIRSKETLL